MSKYIGQMPGDKKCVAAVGAMITEQSIDDFVHIVGNSRHGYSMGDLQYYLLHRKYMLGIPMEVFNIMKFESDIVLHQGYALNKHECCMLVDGVEDKNGKKEYDMGHLVYWDSEKIYDPDTKVEFGLPVKNYDVNFVIPINKIDEDSVYIKKVEEKL